MTKVIKSLHEKGAQAILLACTELGLLTNDVCHEILPILDSVEIHVEEIVNKALS